MTIAALEDVYCLSSETVQDDVQGDVEEAADECDSYMGSRHVSGPGPSSPLATLDICASQRPSGRGHYAMQTENFEQLHHIRERIQKMREQNADMLRSDGTSLLPDPLDSDPDLFSPSCTALDDPTYVKTKEKATRYKREVLPSVPESEEEAIIGHDEQRLADASQTRIEQISKIFLQDDEKLAAMLEEKIALRQELVVESPINTSSTDYLDTDEDSYQLSQKAFTAIKEVNELVSSMYTPGKSFFSNDTLKDAKQIISPDSTLKPDLEDCFHPTHSSPTGEHRPCQPSLSATPRYPPAVTPSNFLVSRLPLLGSMEQISDLPLQLCEYVFDLCDVTSQQMTANESMEVQLQACFSELRSVNESRKRSPAYRLEELRNELDKLSQEKEAWAKKREKERREIDKKISELKILQEQVRAEREQVTQQLQALSQITKVSSNHEQKILQSCSNITSRLCRDPLIVT